MKRPADKGRGLEGVARKARDYYNPATEILEGRPVKMVSTTGRLSERARSTSESTVRPGGARQ